MPKTNPFLAKKENFLEVKFRTAKPISLNEMKS